MLTIYVNLDARLLSCIVSRQCNQRPRGTRAPAGYSELCTGNIEFCPRVIESKLTHGLKINKSHRDGLAQTYMKRDVFNANQVFTAW